MGSGTTRGGKISKHSRIKYGEDSSFLEQFDEEEEKLYCPYDGTEVELED